MFRVGRLRYIESSRAYLRQAACILLASLFIFFLGCDGGTEGTSPIRRVEVSGRLTSAVSRGQIPGAQVTVLQTGDSGVTDAQGNFAISAGISGDSLTLSVDSGEISASVDVDDFNSSTTALFVELELDTENGGLSVVNTDITDSAGSDGEDSNTGMDPPIREPEPFDPDSGGGTPDAPINPSCGDGQLDPGEACDDGNNISGDGCDSLCMFEITDQSVCGDGVRESAEACDDGNTTSGDGCDSQCQIEVPSSPQCGNGILEGSETCDDGNTALGDGCDAQCQIEAPSSPQCGDGILEGSETCDDGNTASGDGCDSQCQTETPAQPQCGNGVVESGEQCDDSNTISGDGCDALCQIEPPQNSLNLWTSSNELQAAPTAGTAWTAVLAAADSDTSNPDIGNQSEDTNTSVLAAAIVYARMGDSSYRDKVVAALETLVQNGRPAGTTMSWGRKTGAYVLAADLIGYRTPEFETWLRNVADVWLGSGRNITMRRAFELRPNRWGLYCFGSLVSIYAYLGDTASLSQVRAYLIQGFTGPNPGFSYGSDLSWHLDESNPRIINPLGAQKNGITIDGVLADDQRNEGPITQLPDTGNASWAGIQGLIHGAWVLDRVGMPIWDVDDQAIYRAVFALQVTLAAELGDFMKAEGDDLWILSFIDHVYGSSFSAGQDVWGHGKNVGWAYILLGG